MAWRVRRKGRPTRFPKQVKIFPHPACVYLLAQATKVAGTASALPRCFISALASPVAFDPDTLCKRSRHIFMCGCGSQDQTSGTLQSSTRHFSLLLTPPPPRPPFASMSVQLGWFTQAKHLSRRRSVLGCHYGNRVCWLTASQAGKRQKRGRQWQRAWDWETKVSSKKIISLIKKCIWLYSFSPGFIFWIDFLSVKLRPCARMKLQNHSKSLAGGFLLRCVSEMFPNLFKGSFHWSRCPMMIFDYKRANFWNLEWCWTKMYLLSSEST